MRRRTSEPSGLQRIYQTQLPDGRIIYKDDILKLEGRQMWYRFLYEGNGALTFWGPTNEQGSSKQSAQFTSVTPDQVGRKSTKEPRNVV